jgi:hypothetical protein
VEGVDGWVADGDERDAVVAHLHGHADRCHGRRGIAGQRDTRCAAEEGAETTTTGGSSGVRVLLGRGTGERKRKVCTERPTTPLVTV